MIRWRFRPALLPLLFPVAALAGCSSDDAPGLGGDAGAGDGAVVSGPWDYGVALPAESHETGDAQRGREILLNGSYMSCGVPLKLWDDPNLGALAQSTLGGAGDETIPGREGRNAGLPYTLNAFTTTDGAEVVNRNCLSCHGGHFDGKLVIGLGNATADFTNDVSKSAPASIPDATLDAFGLSEAEKNNLDKVLRFGQALGPRLTMRTVGTNPAEQLTGTLIAHHDQKTLAWSDEPVIPVVEPKDENGDPIEDARLVSDPPPWWRAHKKNALFYNGMARGDHRGTMALATAVCVDSLEEAERVDALFEDIHAFVLSIRAPEYSRSIDGALARSGKGLFEQNCSGCHGTYAEDPADDERDTYPNLLIPLDVIGTDPAVAMVPIDNEELTDWYNGSFYGEVTKAVPDDPFPGYVAPPLDGIWATAPYLHNGSVPTVELMLNSKARPDVWKRVDLDDENFDEEALGWPYEELEYSQAEAPEEERKLIYDTSYWSQSNAGHTFGDHLTDKERRAVIEYLKTL